MPAWMRPGIFTIIFTTEVLFNIGSSATLAGSGMAFSVSLYEQCLGSKDVSGAGFDKVLQYEIIKRSNRIAFCEEAIVYDQKQPNRRSWLTSGQDGSIHGLNILDMASG
ncbi:glycosyltransferase family 2 protein [Niabella defluvii]|nr:glycosyltransferase family 2 protein [Niabella sp. I65]